MRLLPRNLVVPLASAMLLSTALAAPSQAATEVTTFKRWDTTSELATGTTSNATVKNDAVYLDGGTRGSWTSPWHNISYNARTLVPSWRASTRAGAWIVMEARVRDGNTIGSWDTVASWSYRNKPYLRKSKTAQTDDLTRLSVDTLIANSGKTFDGYQIRVTLKRTSTKDKAPILGAVNVTAATYSTRTIATSATTMTSTVDLAVPASSQMTHRTHNTKYDGGGAAWCSPTSAVMIMRYFGLGPPKADYAWTKETEGYVDQGARFAYDWAYEGTGNWSFTNSFANEYGADAFVTRLASLRDAEQFIKAGIPVAASIAFGKGSLDGAPLTSTPGHIVVIRVSHQRGT